MLARAIEKGLCPPISKRDYGQLLRVWKYNGFSAGPTSIALFEKTSRFNHSCACNVEARVLSDASAVELRALQHIVAGDELTISYLNEADVAAGKFATTEARRDKLLQWGFTCTCSACGEVQIYAPGLMGEF